MSQRTHRTTHMHEPWTEYFSFPYTLTLVYEYLRSFPLHIALCCAVIAISGIGILIFLLCVMCNGSCIKEKATGLNQQLFLKKKKKKYIARKKISQGKTCSGKEVLLTPLWNHGNIWAMICSLYFQTGELL